MEDNLYPISSEKLFKTPKRQQERELKQKLDYESEKPYLHEILKYLREEKDNHEKVSAIAETKDVEKFMIEVRANQRVVEILDNVINHIGGIVKKYDK